MIKKILLCLVVFMALWGAKAYAGDPFEITIQVYSNEGNVYYSPPANTIKVKGTAYVKPLKVIIKNISSSTERLDIDTADEGLGQILFEITDEKENRNVVTKKADLEKSQSKAYRLIGSGNTKEFEIRLNPNDWENAFKFVKEGSSRLRARAVYKNGSNAIYSDYYTIILEE
jgi:hypothetical protein